jgi:hypothetical protein
LISLCRRRNANNSRYGHYNGLMRVPLCSCLGDGSVNEGHHPASNYAIVPLILGEDGSPTYDRPPCACGCLGFHSATQRSWRVAGVDSRRGRAQFYGRVDTPAACAPFRDGERITGSIHPPEPLLGTVNVSLHLRALAIGERVGNAGSDLFRSADEEVLSCAISAMLRTWHALRAMP